MCIELCACNSRQSAWRAMKVHIQLEENYEGSNCTNLNRVSNNTHCNYHCVFLSSFGQTNQLTTCIDLCVNNILTFGLRSQRFESKPRLGQISVNGGCLKHPLLILGPTISRYYNAIVGPMMTFSVRSSKI